MIAPPRPAPKKRAEPSFNPLTSGARHRTVLGAMLLCCSLSCAQDDGVELDELRDGVESGGVAPDENTVLVYETQAVRSPEGELLSTQTQGEMDDDVFQRVGRPWLYTDEGDAYHEHAWGYVDEDGNEVSGYRVMRESIEPTPPPAVDEEPADAVAPDLAAYLVDAAPQELTDVIIRTTFTKPAFPLLPSRLTTAEAEYADAVVQRRVLVDQAAAEFWAGTAGLRSTIESLGGTVTPRDAALGWFQVMLPAGAVGEVSLHESVHRVMFNGYGEDGVCPDPDGVGDPVSLGDLRTFTGSDHFDSLGYHGQLSGGGEVLVGIHEAGEGQDDACFFADFSGCTPSQRLRKKFNCSSGTCSSVSNFSATTNHGAWVASTLLGDYEQSQGAAHESQIAGGAPSGWRPEATGFAREAEAHYYAVGGDEDAKAAAMDCARDVGPSQCATMDILSSSNSIGSGTCDANSDLVFEEASEDLYDDGVFVVVNSGNDPPQSCDVRSPADLPKVFTVGALVPEFGVDYHDWGYADYGNRGGGEVKVGFLTHPNKLSMVDLAASGRPGYITYADNPYGSLTEDSICVQDTYAGLIADAGTSFATPQVAGAAAQILDYFLEKGWNWVTNPGRLHTVMLSMGDRGRNTQPGAAGPTIPACISADRLLCGADFYFGLGRLTIDGVLPYAHWQWTLTSPTTKTAVNTAPLPSNTKIVKCVMHQAEDMVEANPANEKDDMSRVKMTVQIRPPNKAGNCQRDFGTSPFARTDDSYDAKKMVAILDTETNLGGMCYQVTWTVSVVSSAGKVSFHTFCSADSELEY